jgi:hypothetical protein
VTFRYMPSLVEPKITPTATPESTPAAPEATAGAEITPGSPTAPPAHVKGLPDALLQVPAMQGLFAGSPPALSANLKEFAKNPTAELIAKNKDDLMRAGIGFYRSLSGDLGVIFNQMHIHPEDLQAADKAGKLLAVAPNFLSIDHEISKSGPNHPLLHISGPPTSAAAPTMKAPPQFASMGTPTAPPPSSGPGISPVSSAIQKQVMDLRAKSLSPGSPTSGPAPGAGRILNQILAPSV